MVAATRNLEIIVHIVEGSVKVGGAWSVEAEFFESRPNNGSYVFIISGLYCPNEEGVHGAKVSQTV